MAWGRGEARDTNGLNKYDVQYQTHIIPKTNVHEIDKSGVYYKVTLEVVLINIPAVNNCIPSHVIATS